MFFGRNCPRCIYIFQLEAKAPPPRPPLPEPRPLISCQQCIFPIDCQSGNVSSARMQWKTIKLFIPFTVYLLFTTCICLFSLAVFVLSSSVLFATVCYSPSIQLCPSIQTNPTNNGDVLVLTYPAPARETSCSFLLNMNYGIDCRVLGMAARRHTGTRVAAWCWPAWRRGRCSPGYWARRTPSSSTVRISRCSKQRRERERENGDKHQKMHKKYLIILYIFIAIVIIVFDICLIPKKQYVYIYKQNQLKGKHNLKA